MRWAIATLILGLAGCDQVLGLHRNPPDAPAPNLCVEDGPPSADDDGDSQINEVDPCPQVPHQDSTDEDMDGTPDACDLCPQLVGNLAGNDTDCDGIGAACDPQPEAVNTRRFHGFGAQSGVRVDNTVIAAGVARMELTNADGYAAAFVDQTATLPASVETQVTVKNARVVQYWSFEIVIRAGVANFELQLEKRETTNNLYVSNEIGTTVLGEMPIGMIPTTMNDLSFTIQSTVSTSRIRTTVAVDGLGTVTVDSPAAIPTSTIEYGMEMNRDPNATVTITTGVSPYLVYTSIVP